MQWDIAERKPARALVRASRCSPQLVLGGCHSARRCFVKKRHVLTCGLGGRGKQSQQFPQHCSSWKRSAAPHPWVSLPVLPWAVAGRGAGSGLVPPWCHGTGEELPPARLSCSQAHAETRAPRALLGTLLPCCPPVLEGRENLPLPNKPNPSWHRGHLAKVKARFSTRTFPRGLAAWQSPGARSFPLLLLPCAPPGSHPAAASWGGEPPHSRAPRRHAQRHTSLLL